MAFFGLASCLDPFDQTIEFRVDPLLEPYVNQFFIEASARGIKIEKENLLVSFVVENCDCAGKSIDVGQQRTVIIKQDAFDWYLKNSKVNPGGTCHECIENLVFHELGHSILRRQHNDPAFSIMAEGISLRAYEGDSTIRAQLIDELFSAVSTPR